MTSQSLLEKKPDYLVCVCMGIMYTDIMSAIERGVQTFEDLQKELLVGTGCSSCHAEVRQILDNCLNS
jgi:bacterioferritin-associated ferredoxin